MESIWFYDFEFRPLLILHDILSVNWTLYFDDVGQFELHAAIDDTITEVLRKHPYLVAVQGDKQAIITGWQLKDECILYGRSCNWILTRRVTPPFAQVTDTAESLSRRLVTEAFSDVESMGLEEWQGLTEQVTFEWKRDGTTFEAVKKCLEQSELGHVVKFDPVNKQWIFQVLCGKEIETVFSEDNRNISESAYTEDFLDYFTGGWYQAEQPTDAEGHQPEPVRTYCSGENSLTGIYRWECVLEAATLEEAKQEIKQKLWNRQATAMMQKLEFGKDYQLGDFILLTVAKGGFQLTETKRISGVHIWYETEGCGEEPIFT